MNLLSLFITATLLTLWGCSDGAGSNTPKLPESSNLQGGGDNFFNSASNCPTTTPTITTPQNQNTAQQGGANANLPGANGAANGGTGFGSNNPSTGGGGFNDPNRTFGLNPIGQTGFGSTPAGNTGAAPGNPAGVGTQNPGAPNAFGSSNANPQTGTSFGSANSNCTGSGNATITPGDGTTDNEALNKFMNPEKVTACNQANNLYDRENDVCVKEITLMSGWCNLNAIPGQFGKLAQKVVAAIQDKQQRGFKIDQCGAYSTGTGTGTGTGNLIVTFHKFETQESGLQAEYEWICSNQAVCPKSGN